MNQRKKILAAVLALLMILTSFPAYGGEAALFWDETGEFADDGFAEFDIAEDEFADDYIDDSAYDIADDDFADDEFSDDVFIDETDDAEFSDDAWIDDESGWNEEERADETGADGAEEVTDDDLADADSLPETAEAADVQPDMETAGETPTVAVSVELPERIQIDGLYSFSLEADPDAEGMLALTGDEMMLTTEEEKDELEEAAYAEAELLQTILEEMAADADAAELASAETGGESAYYVPAADTANTETENTINEPAADTGVTAADGAAGSTAVSDFLNLSDEDSYIVKTDLLLDALAGDAASSLPAAYRIGSLTPVVSQGALNACWAYSALDAGQIELLGKGIGDGSYIFSPGHLQYAAFHGETESWDTSDKTWQKIGGTPMVAGSTLLRWYGAAPSSSFPTPGSFTSDSYSMTAAQRAISLSHLTGYERLVSPNGTSYAAQPLESRLAAVETIKEYVYAGSPVTIDFSTAGRDASTASYYNATSGINHEAVIVGWDDDRITAASTTDSDGNTVSLPGAFLIKNSYGPYRGENGYEWLSYYDCSMSRPCVFHFENTVTGVHNHEDLFSYDGTGYRFWLTSSAQSLAAANVFTAEHCEDITAVGFYLPAGASYTVTVRADIENGNPASGRVAAQVSGTKDAFGFYTIDLGTHVYVNQGAQFSVTVSSSVNGVSYSYFEGAAYTYTNGLVQTTTCGSGETFVSLGGGSYTDILGTTFTDVVKVSGTGAVSKASSVSGSAYGNACIKAYGNPTDIFTVLDGVDYSAVYDYDYYVNGNASRKKLYAGDPAGALRYFVNTGMAKHQQASASFNVISYLYEYAVVRRACGTDWKAYYLNYMNTGVKKGRHGTGCTAMKDAITKYGGVDYAAVYNFSYYLKKYSSLKTKYQYDDYGALEYFVKTGMAKKQQASSSFNVISYLYEYAVVRRACGTDWKAYYLNYIKYGVKKGRHGTGCTAMKNAITKYGGVDYKYVYDFAYYMNRYGTLKKKYQYDDYGALKYFVQNGTKNMHRASKGFDIRSYVNEYAYLRRKFGTKWLSYYQDFTKYGKKNGRHGTGCTKMKNPLTVYNGKSYAKEYSFLYYISHYAAIKKKYQYDDYGALKYYVTVDRKKGRKAK